MMKKLQRGFTLIELLVVIAIIGILAAVVLASLNDARDGGQDASIKQSLGNARSQAEIYYNGTGGFSYDGVCGTDEFTQLIEAAEANRAETGTTAVIDGAASADEVVCNDSDAGYVLAAPLNVFGTGNEGEVAWCIDSAGGVGEIADITAIDAATVVVCP